MKLNFVVVAWGVYYLFPIDLQQLYIDSGYEYFIDYIHYK